MILAMQRQESKTLTVAFSPYCVGAVVGKITIRHYAKENNDSQQNKKVCIFNATTKYLIYFFIRLRRNIYNLN